jgi:ATP-dependent RNA helicase DeaD
LPREDLIVHERKEHLVLQTTNPSLTSTPPTERPEPPHAGAPVEPETVSPETACDTPPRLRPRRRSRRRKGSAPGSSGRSGAALPPALIPFPEAFGALGVDETGLRAIAALGFETPTPIQAATLPLLFSGEDVVGIAQTGTGKTLAFGLPLARMIDATDRSTQALVLVPTRELATQVTEVIEHLGKFSGFSCCGLVGGRKMDADFSALARGAAVIVGTPGRVLDHLGRGTLSLTAVRFAVLDEADQMLDIGFAPDIDRILRKAPKARQTALFSATMPAAIERLVHRYMRRVSWVSVTPEQQTVEGVTQCFYHIAEDEKFSALLHLYRTGALGRSLVFRRTKIGVDRLTEQLERRGVHARAIHGDLRQRERDRVMSDFRSGRLDFLVATNVASRGLDIPDIAHVINFDVPENADEYIHRIGRTARAGKKGSAVTFVGEWEFEQWDEIVATLRGADLQHRQLGGNGDSSD